MKPKPQTATQLGHAMRKDSELCLRCGMSEEFIEDNQVRCGERVRTKRRVRN